MGGASAPSKSIYGTFYKIHIWTFVTLLARAASAVCGEGSTKRKACKDCSCGLAGMELQKLYDGLERLQPTHS